MNNQEGELTALASAITRKNNLEKLMSCSVDLFTGQNKEIFNALKQLYNAGQEIDSVILSSELKKAGSEIESDYIAEMLGYTTINMEYVLTDLKQKDYQRKIYDQAEQLLQSIKEKPMDTGIFVKKIAEISESYNRPSGFEVCEFDNLKTKELSEIFKSNNFFETGLKALDETITGLFNGQMIVIGARPKRGKTTLAIQIMKNIKKSVIFFSLEMKREEIYSKVLAGDCNVEAWKIETGKMNEFEKNSVLKAHKAGNYRWTVYDGNLDINQMQNIIRKNRDSLVVIDYLQLVQGGSGDNRNERVSFITRNLKLLAHDGGFPIILLSQLSRECEKNNRKPVSSDLRDSGSIEQDADIILFLHEEDFRTEIIIGENRKGKKGIVNGIDFIKQYSRFEDAIPKNFNDCEEFK